MSSQNSELHRQQLGQCLDFYSNQSIVYFSDNILCEVCSFEH